MARKPKTSSLNVETLTHDEATRKNIPTAEYQSMMRKDEEDPVRVTYARGPAEQPDALAHEKGQRNRDLDPQLIWRGKDQQDWSDLVVHAPPLYIQEKVHPKALIDDLLRRTKEGQHDAGMGTADLFADFNGIPKDADKTEFYRHDQNWSNRMILGDSLQVMASLAEREGLRGRVQCIYIDPPYGIKFNSNFQWSTTSRDVKDGNVAHITREPEQVKAFRDTWRDGIHSYLTGFEDNTEVALRASTPKGAQANGGAVAEEPPCAPGDLSARGNFQQHLTAVPRDVSVRWYQKADGAQLYAPISEHWSSIAIDSKPISARIRLRPSSRRRP